MRSLRFLVTSASCMMAIAAIGAAPAYSDNLHGFSCGLSSATSTYPGNSATSPGSTHNEPNINSVGGGTGGSAYNSARQGAGAPSNYDTSCARVTANGTGTPYQPTPNAVTDNNSLATRTANGVVSHSAGP